jgi:undecaprenyl diphosphate synthase
MEVPRHVAIIMDGNRRWAKGRNLPEIMGHRAGIKSVDRITETCARLGIKALTLYTFSTENWKRPKAAVKVLLSLLEESLKNYIKKVKQNNLRLNVIGRIDKFPSGLRDQLKEAMEETSSNTGMVLTLALNYGGRQEILDAAFALYKRAKEKDLDIPSLEEEDFEKFLYTADLPNLDLIIRTSGEMRLSNFLLWQAAYSEIYVTDVLWPDFDEKEMEKALNEYTKRTRRFGE